MLVISATIIHVNVARSLLVKLKQKNYWTLIILQIVTLCQMVVT